jgi:glutathione synthase/RimK-type ligase-like ATP-grasp enzyme
MSVHTRCLVEACKRLDIPHSFVAGDENFLQINIGTARYYFPGASTPFNDGATSKICRDKEFSHKLLAGVIAMPKSMGFVDPEGPERYRGWARVDSAAGIVENICAEFKLPVIVKRNSGSQGQHVFLCKSRDEVTAAVGKVFDKDEQEPNKYDHVVLAQEYITAKKEYRAVVFEKNILLLYEKDISGAVFTGNLSPLHWENSKAVQIADEKVIRRMQEFTTPIYPLLNLRYGGLDIIEDAEGKLVLVELNSRPGFGRFAKDNGSEPLVQMYVKILSAISRP